MGMRNGAATIQHRVLILQKLNRELPYHQPFYLWVYMAAPLTARSQREICTPCSQLQDSQQPNGGKHHGSNDERMDKCGLYTQRILTPPSKDGGSWHMLTTGGP